MTRPLAVLLAVVAVLVAVYFIADETPSALMARLSQAGATIAGAFVVAWCVDQLTR